MVFYEISLGFKINNPLINPLKFIYDRSYLYQLVFN